MKTARKCKQVIFSLAAASLLSATPAWAANPPATPEQTATQRVNGDVMEMVDKSLQETAKLLPYLDEFPFKSVELREKANGTNNRVLVKLKKFENKEKPYVQLAFDKNTGELLSFNLVKELPDDKATLPQKEAIEKATSFLKQWYGDELRGYRLDPNHTTDPRFIVFTQTVNGLFYPNLSLTIRVDNDGRIAGASSYHAIFSSNNYPVPDMAKTRFPDPKKAVSKDEIEKTFAGYMKLFYVARPVISVDPATRIPTYGEPSLRYKPVFSGYIDAVTGKELAVPRGEFYAFGPIVKVTPESARIQIKNKSEAADLLEREYGLEVQAEKVTERESDDRRRKLYVWQNDEVEASVSVDIDTAQVVGFQLDGWEEGKNNSKKRLALEEAREIAIKAMNKYMPDETKEMMVLGGPENDEQDGLYSFRFAKVHQGIPVWDNGFYFEIDGITGKMINMSGFDPEPITLPDPEKAVSAEQAAKEYLKHHPLELQYFYPENNNNEAVLNYTAAFPYEPQHIDAFTGKIIEKGKQ